MRWLPARTDAAVRRARWRFRPIPAAAIVEQARGLQQLGEFGRFEELFVLAQRAHFEINRGRGGPEMMAVAHALYTVGLDLLRLGPWPGCSSSMRRGLRTVLTKRRQQVRAADGYDGAAARALAMELEEHMTQVPPGAKRRVPRRPSRIPLTGWRSWKGAPRASMFVYAMRLGFRRTKAERIVDRARQAKTERRELRLANLMVLANELLFRASRGRACLATRSG